MLFRSMKTIFSTLLLSSLAVGALADESPLWMRNSSISPDGSTIAFCYKGDIFTVPTAGGRAFQLTTHPGYDTKPVWSPDGSKIAFASDREKSFNVYVVDKNGGVPTKLTTHSESEYPVTFLDNQTVLFKSGIMSTSEYTQFPGRQFSQIYSVDVKIGRAHV